MLRVLKPRILCVDDQQAVAALLAAIIGVHREYVVEIETNPLAVVDRAKRFRPDLIILDINMPMLSGTEIAKCLRSEPGLCHTPIVFYSGVSEMEEAAIKAAGNEHVFFLAKDSPMVEVETLVDRLLHERLQFLRESLPYWACQEKMI